MTTIVRGINMQKSSRRERERNDRKKCSRSLAEECMGRNFFLWKFERKKNGSFYCKFKFISIISFCLRFGRFFALTPASTQTITVCLRNRFSLHLHSTYTMASNVRRKKPVKQKKINDLCTSATEAVISAQQLLLLYTHTMFAHNISL